MSYFDRDKKVVILCNPKCASTSIQAFFAGREGIDVDRWCDLAAYDEVGWAQALGTTREAGILRGQLLNLDGPSRLEATTSPAVTRVAFVREPISRLWSAWLSKICFREPRFRDLAPTTYELGTSEWLDRLATIDGTVKEFERFVLDLVQGGPASFDIHFAPQASILVGLVPETRFLDVSQASEFIAKVFPDERREFAALARLNSTGFRVPAEFVSSEAIQALEHFYEEDFEHFQFLPRESRPESPEAVRAEWRSLLPVIDVRVRAAARLGATADHLREERFGRQGAEARLGGAFLAGRALAQQNNGLESRVDELRQEVRSLERGNDRLRQEVGSKESENETLSQEVGSLREVTLTQSGKIKALDSKCREVVSANTAIQAELTEAVKALGVVYDSRSWRLTRPLRALGSIKRK